MAGPPSIVQVTCDATQLRVVWTGTGIGPDTSCQVTLTNGAGQPTNYPATGTAANITVNLSTGGPWSVTVTVVGDGTSPSVPIVTASGTILKVINLGPSITIALTLAAGTTSSYVELQQQGSGQSEGWLVSGTSLDIHEQITGNNWQISLRGVITSGMATSYGPAVVVPLITASPQITQLYNSSTNVQAVWTQVTGYSRYLVSLQQGSNPAQTQSVTGFTYTFPVAVSGSGWQVTVAAQSPDQVSTGPPSPAAAVIVAVPAMARISYTVPSLSLLWTLVGGYQKYTATLWQSGNSISQPATGNTAVFTGPFSGSDWYCAVRAQSDDGVSYGPPSTTYQPIFAAPTLDTFAYDGSNVAVTWTNAAAPTATGNFLSITSGGQGASFEIGMTGAASVPAALQADLTYAAVVYASAGIVFGPASQALVPITAPPQAIYLGYDGTTLLGSWQAPPHTTPTSYQVTLTANGTTVANPTLTTTTYSFGINLAVATAYAMQIRAVAGAVTGPPNTPISGPYAANQIFTFDGFGRVRAVNWNDQQTMHWTYDTAGNLLTQTLTTP